MAAKRKFKRDPRLPFQELDGRAVVVVPAKREMHELDEVATFLWRKLAEQRTVPELVEAVCGEFEVDAGRAGRDVRKFLKELKAKGLVTSE